MFGLDLLGSAMYRRAAISALPPGFALGGFATTFGDFYPVARAALKKGCPLVRVQLLWSDTHSFSPADLPQIRKLSAQYEKLAQAFPRATIELSPCCEHNLQDPDRYLDAVQEAAPHCIPVNSVWRGALSKRYKNEVHGDRAAPKGPYNYSLDGGIPNPAAARDPKAAKYFDCVDIDITALKKQHAAAEVFFLWHSQFNLRYSPKDTRPRPERLKAPMLPSPKFIGSIAYQATDKGPTKLPPGWLPKSHAERHGLTDPKGDKLLIISPIKAPEITLKRNGKKIDTLKYYGPYSEGGHRYYSTRLGYESAPHCEVFANGKKYGTINPGFRSEKYRS